jgi:2-phospho-L-lactate/phosphoenolpyruvate guanylyltransferase
MSLFEVLIPVKGLDAKSRLSAGNRQELAQAFLKDTTDSCSEADLVSAVHVVTDAGRGLNGDLAHAHEALGRPRTAVILGDLPCLTADVIDDLLSVASVHARWFVSDASGVGTTILGVDQGQVLDPRFGPRSRAAHRSSGAVELQLDNATSNARLRRDVDTDVDMWDAVRLGVGPATAQSIPT